MKLPKIADVFNVADSYATKDQFVKKSIDECYMDIDEFSIAKYVSMAMNDNIDYKLEFEDMFKEAERIAPQLCFLAAIEFQVSPSYVLRLYEKSKSIRSRHMDL